VGKATGYLRYPTISGDTIAFACDDDLWCVGADGGRAWRLTAGIAEASRPRLSPDGTRVAFTGTSEGPTEVFVLPVEGGDVRRLTFDGARCTTAGWLDDETIVYASNAGLPFGGDQRLYRISAHGGAPAQLNVGFAGAFSYSAAGPGGPMVLARHTGREPAQWKRYRGGTAGQLWIDPVGDGTFRPLLRDLHGNLASPCWVGDRVYFLSDHEGIGNVYSVRPDGSDLRRHTDHSDYYARNLATDGTRLVYHCAADLYLLDPANGPAEQLDVRIEAGGAQRARRFVDAGKYLHSARLSQDGARIAITARGKAFSFGAWDGPVVQHGEPEGTRYQMLSWLPSGKELVAAAADIEPDEALVVLSADGSEPPRTLEGLDLGGIERLAVSPADAKLAVTNHRNELILVDLTGDQPTATIRDSSRFGPIADAVFSPDGRWLAYRFPEAVADPDSDQHSSIKLMHVETGRTARAAERVLHDCSPVFDPDGKYLYFIGYREFNPLYDSLHFDLSYPRGARPYAIALRSDVPSPFLAEPRPPGDDDKERKDKEDKEAKAEAAAPTPVEVELEGITRRVVQFPVAEARYTRVLAMRGKVALLSTPTDGSIWWGDQLMNSQGVLEYYDLTTKQTEKVADKVTDVQLSADATTLLYRTGDRLRVLEAGEKPPEGDEPGRRSGWVDLGRVKASVRPAYEWPQMFREAWRAARHYHWSDDLSGVDWQRVYDRYAPLVARISTRGELSDLLWEMQGELGTSHAYEYGGDYGRRPDYEQGHLGADYAVDAETGVWRIARIVQGDPADPTASSPLERPGVNAAAGDEIVAINGLPVGPSASPAERLVNLAGQELNLTIRDSSGHTRTVRVEALGDERRARYREWVEANRRHVHEASAGRLGYVHIPDMLPPGYSEFMRGYLAEYDRDGLVIDVRFNGGGHVSGLVLEKLARRRLGQDYLRWNVSQPYPQESPRGPMVALTNANAGSDGDIVCQGFKMLELGPLLGERTWGGVVGYTRYQQLADNSTTTQPMLAFSFDDVSWGVENHGVEPDIEVMCAPQDYAAGRDPQLEKAIEVALEELEKRPPHSHTPAERPHLGLPTLPPRRLE
jgi:tricorn protease